MSQTSSELASAKSRQDKRRWYLINREKILKRSREKYQKDPDKARERAKIWYYENKENALKKSREKRKRTAQDTALSKSIKEKKRQWYLKNKDRILKKTKERYLEKKEEILRVAREAYDPKKARAYNLMRKYKLTQDKLNEIFESQGMRCFICKSDSPGYKKGWSVDHCHSSGNVRFILCGHCNVGLGKFRDNPVLMRNAADILEMT